MFKNCQCDEEVLGSICKQLNGTEKGQGIDSVKKQEIVKNTEARQGNE